MCFVASLFFAGGAGATVATLTSDQPNMTSQSDGYPDLVNVNVSPNVRISVYVAPTQDNFEVIGVNTKGTIEYGVVSTDAYIYFHTCVMSDGDSPTTATGTASTGWATMGDSASGGSSGG